MYACVSGERQHQLTHAAAAVLSPRHCRKVLTAGIQTLNSKDCFPIKHQEKLFVISFSFYVGVRLDTTVEIGLALLTRAGRRHKDESFLGVLGKGTSVSLKEAVKKSHFFEKKQPGSN